jgi:hypothetical protein
MLAATLLMSAALLGVRLVLVPEPGRHVAVPALGVLIAVGLVSYGVLAQVFRVFDAAGFVRRAVARLRRT